ncbi:hypothetical protein C8R46DRAFT_281249 [Mycena filopes]|nr:hypothetical protein C8R46DRAFT_281249 [Mycena filopes]
MVCASKDQDQDTVAADDLQHHIEMQNARIEELEKKYDARIEELEKKHDAERTERTVAESMKWALEQENAELKQTAIELRHAPSSSAGRRGQDTDAAGVHQDGRAPERRAGDADPGRGGEGCGDGGGGEVGGGARNEVPGRERCPAEVQQTLRQGYAQEVGERVGMGGRGDESYEGEARRAAERGLRSRRRDRVYRADFRSGGEAGKRRRRGGRRTRYVDLQCPAGRGAAPTPPEPGQAAAVHQLDNASLGRYTQHTRGPTPRTQGCALRQPARLSLCFCYKFGAVCVCGDEGLEG